jgi:hypothetical protein
MAASTHDISGLIAHDINLNTYPEVDLGLDDAITEVQFGDMHGNTLKILALLKSTGIIDIPKDKYDDFVKLYTDTYNLMEDHSRKGQTTNGDLRYRTWKRFTKENPVFTAEMNIQFEAILASIHVINKERFVTFLGDILSDRGASDYLTLKLLAHLKKEGMQYRIIFSNHDLEFVWQYERLLSEPVSRLDDRDDQIMYRYAMSTDRHQGASVHHLLACVRQEVISLDELTQIVREAYYPHLELFGYSLKKVGDGLYVLSHAPMSLNEMASQVEQKFDITINTNNRKKFAQSIDKLNTQFKQILLDSEFTSAAPWQDDASKRQNPIYQIVWSRHVSSDSKPLRETDFDTLKPVTFIHGHSMDKRGANPRPGVLTLDDVVGKDMSCHSGIVFIAALAHTELKSTLEVSEAATPKASRYRFYSPEAIRLESGVLSSVVNNEPRA